MAVTGLRRDPLRAFNFLVEIEGLICGGFSECGGLQSEVETREVREGGVNDHLELVTGRIKHPPLILKRGLADLDGLWDWYQAVARGQLRRRNGSIFLLDALHLPVMQWDFKDALPTRWAGPELKADANGVAFESVELVHRGLQCRRL